MEMQTTRKLDVPYLKNVCEQSPQIKAMFEIFLDRARGRQDFTVPRARRLLKEEKGIDLTRADVVMMMKLWQKAGCGRFVSGRHEQDNRFIWDWSIPTVAEQVLGRKSLMTRMAEEREAAKGTQVAQAGVALKEAPKTRVKLPKAPSGLSEASVDALMSVVPMSNDTQATKTLKVRFDGFEIELPADMNEAERQEAQMFVRNLRATI